MIKDDQLFLFCSEELHRLNALLEDGDAMEAQCYLDEIIASKTLTLGDSTQGLIRFQ